MRTVLALSLLALACNHTTDAAPGAPPDKKPPPRPPLVQTNHENRMYTTYFYTANEAVVHGYEDKTKVRIVALADPAIHRKAGTIWEGTIGLGETKLIPTGAGVFGLLSDKKASILVGTPSSCAVVGYFLKDQEGRFRSNRFFAQLPGRTYQGSERVVVWAYDAADVSIRNPKTQKELKHGSLAAGGHIELDADQLAKMGDQVIEIASRAPASPGRAATRSVAEAQSTKSTIAVEVYYDEGFIVPSVEGRGVGTDFYTFVGAITQGTNDLDVVAMDDAHVTITDLDTKKKLYDGSVKARAIHTTNLANRYVRVQSDKPIEVMVAAYDHDGSGYAEHHFATGREGGGIDNDFEVTTSQDLWLFSYFDHNAITVTDRKGKQVFAGKLDAGSGHGISPGVGLYRVHSDKGMSVMGGASSCGADYSPAAGMFAVDDAMLQVIQQVAEQRIEDARARGVTMTQAQAEAAPLSAAEWDKYGAPAKAKSYSKMSLEEANERVEAVKKK